MKRWFETFDESLWLKGDDSGTEEAAFIRKALGLRKGDAVLDAPCGAGRIAVPLALAGCKMTGIDLRPAFIERATKRFSKAGLQGRFLALDLLKMSFQGLFHAAVNYGGSFGYFTDTENLELVRKYAAALRPGGRLLIDQPNRQNTLRHFVAFRNGGNVVKRNRWDRQTSRIDSTWTIVSNGKRLPNRMSMRLYTLTEFKGLFERCGLVLENAYGSSNGDSYVQTSKRLIVIGRKE